MERYLWKFYWDCRRSGELESLFVASENDVKEIIGRYANFGEVLGKHSEVYGTIEESDITKLDLDPETVEKVSKILGSVWSGYNPFEYVYRTCPVCESRYPGYEWNDEKNMCGYCVDNDGGYDTEDNEDEE